MIKKSYKVNGFYSNIENEMVEIDKISRSE